MKRRVVLALILIVFLTGCDNSKSVETKLTCETNQKGRSIADQTAIAEAYFRGGSFKKSAGQVW